MNPAPVTPIHSWPDEPAATSAVRKATASSDSEKNRAGQRGPRRNASRACVATIIVANSGNSTSSTRPSPSRSGDSKSNAAATG
jgi:hypothetical protein